jgi:hypothetical protein
MMETADRCGHKAVRYGDGMRPGGAVRAATRTAGDRGRERPENWNATGGCKRLVDWSPTGAGNDGARETTGSAKRSEDGSATGAEEETGAGGGDRPENAALADGLRSRAAVATRAGHLGSKVCR